MSNGLQYLHSHSALERELNVPKHLVLADAQFKDLFLSDAVVNFRHMGRAYIKVPTLTFVKKHGVFRNFDY